MPLSSLAWGRTSEQPREPAQPRVGNHSGDHPDIIAAITTATVGHAVSYGEEPHIHALDERLVGLLGEGAEVFGVSGGGD